MTRKSPEQRILDGLVAAARADSLSEFATHALETRLRQRWLAQSQRETRSGAVNRFARWAPLAIAAAVILSVGIVTLQHSANRRVLPPRTSGERGLNGDHLRDAEPIIAGERPLIVTHAGRANWTLAPHGHARIIARSPCLTVSLEAGRIDAQVQPNARAETFAIETQLHRVAVHGTRFSVELDRGGILVDVSSGSVVVTRRDEKVSNSRSLLTAPQRLRFPAQEPAGVPSLAAPAPLTNFTHRHHSKSASPSNSIAATAVSPPAAEPELPLYPSLVEQQTALDVVRAAAARCFAQANDVDAESLSDVRVRVETLLTLSISPTGRVGEISFTPPVPSGIADCTQREVSDWATTASQLGANPSRAIILNK